jgi:two-component system CheB/CheR fusion protein
MTTGTVIINRDYRILYINPAARRHLGIHGIAINEDLIHVVQHVPLTELRNSVEQALQGQSDSRVFAIEAPSSEIEVRQYIEFICAPIADEVSGSDILVQTIDVTEQHQTSESLRETAERLQRQILSFQNLEATNRRLTDINTRLHANNEELLITNEEFQAAGEEVETLNEELQATNEELETLNEELQATIEELNTTNEDLQIRSREMEILAAESEDRRRESEARQLQLQATLASMDEAVMLVDPSSNVVVTNPTFDSWFEDDGMLLIPDDLEGNRLPEDEWPQRRASNGEEFSMRFSLIHESGERWVFEAKGQPIRGHRNQTGGVVVISRIPTG